MEKNQVSFRRINGRVVPIRSNKKTIEQSHYGKFAAGGALRGAIDGASSSGGPKFVKTTTKTGFSIGLEATPFIRNKKAQLFGGLIGAGIVAANIVDSYNHGKKEKSVVSGLSRGLKNALATGAGGLAGFSGAFGAKHIGGKVAPVVVKEYKTQHLNYRIKKSGFRVVK
jgi:hypothetical protein